MKIYIYDVNTMILVAIADGKNNEECEQKASDYIGNNDNLAATYCHPNITGVCGQVIASAAAEKI
jgi:hypothetical protein